MDEGVFDILETLVSGHPIQRHHPSEEGVSSWQWDRGATKINSICVRFCRTEKIPDLCFFSVLKKDGTSVWPKIVPFFFNWCCFLYLLHPKHTLAIPVAYFLTFLPPICNFWQLLC